MAIKHIKSRTVNMHIKSAMGWVKATNYIFKKRCIANFSPEIIYHSIGGLKDKSFFYYIFSFYLFLFNCAFDLEYLCL